MNSEGRDDTKSTTEALEKGALSLRILLCLAGMGFLSGAALGQAIDIAYPMNGALHYHWPTWEWASLGIEICWWIPLLYGTAGAILVVTYPLFDRRRRQKPRGGLNPSWGFTLGNIGIFVVQWWMGPYLHSLGVPTVGIFFFTVPTALLVWWVFDNTGGGLLMCLVTATIGPMIEITLINGFNLYSYTSPDVFGIPLWILGAYMCGAPANGNLGRKYLAFLERHLK
ncbi:MAG: hypothetical protein HWN65_11830 [Candidatus Helarchaeota archaeon]|nr:hypothetical protein [Candidatus Helarchaeota archaeon]